jgi:hypothetical protein
MDTCPRTPLARALSTSAQAAAEVAERGRLGSATAFELLAALGGAVNPGALSAGDKEKGEATVASLVEFAAAHADKAETPDARNALLAAAMLPAGGGVGAPGAAEAQARERAVQRVLQEMASPGEVLALSMLAAPTVGAAAALFAAAAGGDGTGGERTLAPQVSAALDRNPSHAATWGGPRIQEVREILMGFAFAAHDSDGSDHDGDEVR